MIYNMEYMHHHYSPKLMKEGEKLYNSGCVTIKEATILPSRIYEGVIYGIIGLVKDGEKIEKVNLCLGEGRVHTEKCSCREDSSGREYYGYYGSGHCKHTVAAIFGSVKYFLENPQHLPVNYVALDLIEGYQRTAIVKNSDIGEEQVDIEAIIERNSEHFSVSFKIGTKKKYVLKNLFDFADNMKKKEHVEYGKDLTVIHDLDSFTMQGQKMAQFIIAKMQEVTSLLNDLQYSSYARKPERRSLHLTPSLIEDLFEALEGQELTYIDKSVKENRPKPTKLRLENENPKIKVEVEQFYPSQLFRAKDKQKSDVFAGIMVKAVVDGVIEGKTHTYVVQQGVLYQGDAGFKRRVEPFLRAVSREKEGLYIGTGQIGAFYAQVLGQIKQDIELKEYNHQEIIEQLPPEPEFHFYLDKAAEYFVCRGEVTYGEKRYHLQNETQERSLVANKAKEIAATMTAQKYFPYYDLRRGTMYSETDQDAILDILEDGIGHLMEHGEVLVSDAIKSMKIRHSPKVSVGVTVKSNLLEVLVDSEEFSFAELKDVLASYRQKKRFHRLKNGDFLKLEDNSLTALSELMESMHIDVKSLVKGKLHIPAYRTLYLDRILHESEGINYNRDKKVKEMLRNFKSVEDTEYEIPVSLQSVLRPYQKVGYQWLRMMEAYGFGGILADDMGLGKTLQMIAVLLAAKEEGRVERKPSLIVCPASLVYNWESECKQFAPQLSVVVIAGTVEERRRKLEMMSEYDVVVTSYDLLKRDIDCYEYTTFAYQIIDEAQYIKNQTTQVAKSVKVIQADTKFALTGTPIENRLSELWSIFDYLMPGFLYQYEKFKKEMETPIAKRKEEQITARLKGMVGPFILRRLKKDVLKDLPDKLEQVTYAKMDGQQKKVYEAYVAKIREELNGKTSDEFTTNKLKLLAELTRLRQLCCDPSLVYENYEQNSAKLDTCMELVHNAMDGNHKVLLFSQFTSMLWIIEERLKEENISYYVITGSAKKEERMRLVNEFNKDDTTVFLISLKAGGTGLNLTGADIVIHYDPWWNVAAQNQATDRAHRIGQKKVVSVFKLIMKDTIEEKIMKMQMDKKDLADQIISEDTNQLQTMTKDDFVALLG